MKRETTETSVLVIFVDTRGVQIMSSMEEFVQGMEQRSKAAKSKDAPIKSKRRSMCVVWGAESNL